MFTVTFFIIDLPLTKKNVHNALSDIKWPNRLGNWLGIPRFQINQILEQFSNNDNQKLLDEYIKYFMEHDPLASWRRIIVVLDDMMDHECADKIRHLAEPVTGIYAVLIRCIYKFLQAISL